MSPSAAPETGNPVTSPPVVAVLANGHFVKARSIAERLDQLGVKFEIFDVDHDPRAQAAFGNLFGDGRVKTPALVLGSRLFRNPRTGDLEKLAIRHGLVRRKMLHDEAGARYVWPMMPSDAFASYAMRDGRKTVGHIEIDASLRGSGLGARLAQELLDALQLESGEIRLTCSFLRKVAARRKDWTERFL